ncbi:MAG: hypothetical protein CSA35_00875 [Dethiosulfovibrio peptidovorans]|nr:MAG: hypothetical protein CSA35_00875 [Dethiosulfovibrio peptidovorans]
MKKRVIVALAMALCLSCAAVVMAHTPICSCYLNGDGTATCEGGFSDGSSAAGVKMTVRTSDGTVIQEGAMDDLGEFSFKVPEGAYEVEFNAGPGHQVIVKGEDIQ